jgi:long-chain-fatty-acid--CoA ligase ACSBG
MLQCASHNPASSAPRVIDVANPLSLSLSLFIYLLICLPLCLTFSHDNVTWTTATLVDTYLDLNHTDRIVSFLPLSHIAAQIIDVHAPIHVGACTYFAQPDALKGSLTVSLGDVRPTFFFGVPRVWEKIQEKMVELGRESPAVLRWLSGWAKAKGRRQAELAQFGASGGSPWCIGCANMFLKKIKEKLGLGDCRACFTGAAPISADTLWYFGSLGIPIYEVFGQSECTGPQTVATSAQWRVGTTGRPMAGTESRIFPDGELCYRGRHIFMGYMYMEQETRDAIDEDGFLHSGDIAEFDDDNDPRVRRGPAGFMRITGRKKELIIGSGGENVAPVLIENAMKAAMLAASNVMVVGDRRKYLVQLVSLKTVPDAATGAPTDLLAADALHEGKNIGSRATTVSEAAACPLWKAYLDRGLAAGNKGAISNAQVVQKWGLLPKDFCEADGTLTPTLKLKRKQACQRDAALIESLYAE